MIDLIYSFVCNGTVIGNYGYMEGLPFYNYGLYLMSIGIMFVVSAYFRSWNMAKIVYSLFIASILSLLPVYFSLLIIEHSPLSILGTWIIITTIIYLFCIVGISDAEKRKVKEKNDNEKK